VKENQLADPKLQEIVSLLGIEQAKKDKDLEV